jgi:hypothetical protein
LYVTVRSKWTSKQPTGKSTEEGPSSDYPESIVACINFALIGINGFYINWLATSNEDVSARKYGEDMAFLCKGGSWQRNSFALFLIKAVNLAVISHHHVINAVTRNYNILLQARTSPEEISARFYLAIGFEEGGSVESTRELNNEVYVGFHEQLQKATESHTDYIHFIWNADDIVIFKNVTGKIGRNKSFLRSLNQIFPSLEIEDPPEVETSSKQSKKKKKKKKKSPFKADISFPFTYKRNHLMLLATNLEFLYLPFTRDVDMMDCITPNVSVLGNQCTDIQERNRLRMGSEAAWLDDRCMDFFIRWYVYKATCVNCNVA